MSALLVYQLLGWTVFVANVGIALVHVFAPERFAKLVGLEWKPDMRPFARAWGSTLLGLHLCYVPSLIDPIGMDWLTWSSIAIKIIIMPATFWANQPGFRLFGLWDLCWGVSLLVAYVAALGSA